MNRCRPVWESPAKPRSGAANLSERDSSFSKMPLLYNILRNPPDMTRLPCAATRRTGRRLDKPDRPGKPGRHAASANRKGGAETGHGHPNRASCSGPPGFYRKAGSTLQLLRNWVLRPGPGRSARADRHRLGAAAPRRYKKTFLGSDFPVIFVRSVGGGHDQNRRPLGIGLPAAACAVTVVLQASRAPRAPRPAKDNEQNSRSAGLFDRWNGFAPDRRSAQGRPANYAAHSILLATVSTSRGWTEAEKEDYFRAFP